MEGLWDNPIMQVIAAPVSRLLLAGGQTYWVTYLAAAGFAGMYYLFSRRSRKTSLRGLLHYLSAKALWRHPDTKMDIVLYVFSSMFIVLQGFILLGIPESVRVALAGLTAVFGKGPGWQEPLWLAWLMPVLLFLALELGYWLAHYAMHRLPFLWEFHKVHHSAEVMTPLTEWRQHPLELTWFPVIMNITVALVYAPVLYLTGGESELEALRGMSIFALVFFFTLLHLRHSHVKMQAPRWLCYLIQTPAHHHIHHSVRAKHFDKNLGYCLSVWDWAFGTLYLPEKGQRIRFGLGDEGKEFRNLRGSMITPVKRALALRVNTKKATS